MLKRPSVLMGAALAKKRVRSAQEAPHSEGEGGANRGVKRCAVGRAGRRILIAMLERCGGGWMEVLAFAQNVYFWSEVE